MRHARALLPYALASVAIVVASAVVLGASAARERAPEQRVAAPVAGPQLSDAGRLTYWKEADRDWKDLWLSDLDGRRAWPAHREGTQITVTSTRWAPDGSAVAYVRANTSLVIVPVGGPQLMLRMPGPLVKEGWRIAGYSLSPSAARVAFTLRPVSGASRVSDVFIADVIERSPWTRLTTFGNAFAGRWISERELFIETASGMLAVGNVERPQWPISPITGMLGASPVLRPDGRVYFAGGTWANADSAGGPWAGNSVWSAWIDGSDLRRETTVDADQMRIQGRLADGRFVIGVPGSTYIVGDALVPMPWRAGTVRRVIVSEDGRDAIGITDSKVLRIVASKIPHSNDVTAPLEAVSTLLAGVADADVWFPSSLVAPDRAVPARPAGPPARLAFTLGGILWEQSAQGTVKALASGSANGWIGTPKWSPTGDRIAVVISEAQTRPNTSVVVLGSAGELWRSPLLSSAFVSWSPDGARLAISSADGDELYGRTTQVFDARTGEAGERYDDAHAQWTPLGLILLTEGRLHPVERHLVDQSVDLLRDGVRTRITDARRLSAHPMLRDVPGADRPATISQVQPSADGRFLGVWVYRIQNNGFSHGVFAVVRTSDGEPVTVFPFEPRVGIQDLTWSPTSSLMGRTMWQGAGPTAAHRAQVVDALDGRVLVEQPGRFAGWAPGGDWVYVARNEGLFAYPLAGGEGVRINSFGVQVQATRP